MVYLLRDDVTTLLMNVLVVPVFAEDLDDRGIFTQQETSYHAPDGGECERHVFRADRNRTLDAGRRQFILANSTLD
jgi:hypothetical protein